VATAIYVDTSVALAQLLAEDRRPPAELWERPLLSSRLLCYELWTRLHARGLGRSHAEPARDLISRIAFVELVPVALARALEPFPVEVRTLDAIHLAAMDFLRAHGERTELATYDARMSDAAAAMGFETFRLPAPRR